MIDVTEGDNCSSAHENRVHAEAGFTVFTPIRSRYPAIQSSAIADGMVMKP